MSLTKLALKRPVSCVLIIIALIVFGVSSVFGFKMELIPEMDMPMLFVMTTYPGADPESVDELVTNVIEDAGSVLSGVDSVTSQSNENYSVVMFSYDYGVDIDECYTDLREALDAASVDLPEDAGEPTVMEININSQDIVTISATEIGDVDLLKVINESVVKDLGNITGVADVKVSGGSEDYIKIELNQELLNQYGLTMTNVSQYLSAVDFSYPAGNVKQSNQNVSISTTMEYNTVQKLKNIPLSTKTGKAITLQDVATVTNSSKEADSISRFNGNDNVSIGIQKKQSSGTVNVCNSIEKAVTKIQDDNPAIDFQITYNASDSIISSLSSVGETLLLGVILSMLVLFLFFGDFKASLIVGSSMPISLFVTLVGMNFCGFSLNIVTLGSLVIAIGMMVDSSIVVIESCFRAQEKGVDFKEAALNGTKEVAASIIASTITTIVVYAPLIRMQGLSGQMFYQLGMTIVLAMIASLVAAMTLVPLFYYKFHPVAKKEIPMNKIVNWITIQYQKLLRRILYRKKTALAVSIGLLVIAILMATQLNMELMPSADEGIMQVSVSFRSGTTMEAKDDAMKKLEKMAEDDDNVATYSLNIASDSSASLTATLEKDRNLSTAQMVDKWNELAAGITGMDITVTSSGNSMTSMMSTSSKEIDVEGYNIEALKDASEQIVSAIQSVDGVVKVESSATASSTLAQVVVDPLEAMNYGLTPISVGMELHNVLSGMNPITITKEGAEYEVWIEYPDGMYNNLNGLMNLNMTTPYNTTVPLRDIAQIEYTDSPETIVRADGKYQITINVTTTEETKFTAADEIDRIVDSLTLPDKVVLSDGMMNEMMMEEFKEILKAILIAVFLVFLVMAMQFESPRFSFMVMMCIPFSLIGSFFLLFVTRSTISMVSLMGFLMLMGIVVNNGILYVDSTNQLRSEMSVEDALIETGAIRLRPILMTTLTTILSMIPLGLGIGTNAVMMQGMALVIIGGLIASTILTLVLIPTIYLIIDKRRKEKE